MDPEPFRDLSVAWLSRGLAPHYENCIRDRLERFKRAFTTITKGGIDDGLTQALVIWNEGLFCEVHERLEPIWQNEWGEKRQALKGLIKAAGGKFHK
ncbi:MAG: DUF309 domain-containing protein [Deltaproteobacteria bacterium]|nr:MAG: DUF309 domain-containing protein [Deltaproteobacteria bacterium]